ncbi:MAG TPA: alpha/beta hydrolase family protein [Armatimonadota bacterium]|jgi:hypothetical protein
MITPTDWMVAHHAHGERFAPLEMLNQWWRTITPRLPFRATNCAEFAVWQAEIRAALTVQLGQTPPALPLQPRILAAGQLEAGVRFRYGEVETAPGMTVPFIVLVPDELTTPRPGVLCVHGHGDGMNPLIGRDAEGEALDDYQHAFALEACRRGYVALTFDLMGFGRRRDFWFLEQFGGCACDTPSEFALHLGSSMAALRLFDAQQMVTLLALQPEVDATRIATAGISGGGLVSFFLSVLDERVRAAMISGYFNRFAAFMQVAHCVDNFVPGMATLADLPDFGCAIAPRPLLISQGEHDPIFPLDATRDGVVQLRSAYRLFDAEDRLEEEYYDAEHEFSHARVWDFFREWV